MAPESGIMGSASGMSPSNMAVRDYEEVAAWIPRALGVLLVACGCYVAQQLSFTLRFPPAGFTTICLPGGIMLATFLIAPRRQWLIYGIGAAVGTFFALLPVVPLMFAIAGPVTTVAFRALLADLLRRLCPPCPDFGRFRHVLVYLIIAGVLFPAVFSLVASAVSIATGWRTGFWHVWRALLLADLNAHMTATAAIVALAGGSAFRTLQTAPPRRYIELLLLAAAVIACAWIAESEAAPDPILLLTVAPLPLLIWAAVRFGPGGTAAVLLGVMWISSKVAVEGRGPFMSGSAEQNVFWLQLYLATITVPMLFLAALIRERREIEAALRSGEERYREVVEAQSELVCRYLPDGTLTFVNDAYCRFFGKTREELIGISFFELLPESARSWATDHVRSLAVHKQPRRVDHQVTLPDGKVGWQQWMDHAICGPDGIVSELQGIGRDITDLKHVEESLRRNEAALRDSYDRIKDLAGRLIEAQEAERTRIARELHDGVNQQLAALSISLSGLRRKIPESATQIQQSLAGLQREAMQLADDLRNLSHELHPGVLRHVGLVPALRAYCDEFQRSSGVEVAFDGNGGDSDGTSPEVSLCVYRVAQEALRNVARHAGAQRVHVTLANDRANLRLRISDDGRGFDPLTVRSSGGLGLLSIDERVRLLRGDVKIESTPQVGTQLHVQVPLGDLQDGTIETAPGR